MNETQNPTSERNKATRDSLVMKMWVLFKEGCIHQIRRREVNANCRDVLKTRLQAFGKKTVKGDVEEARRLVTKYQ